MNLFLPELFYQITTNLNDKEKIFLTSCSKITYNSKSLLILDLEYDIKELKLFRAKNIIINDYSLEAEIKELIKDLIPESIIVNHKYVKFVSNDINVKLLFCVGKIVSYGFNYLAMKIMLNNGDSKTNINEQLVVSSRLGYIEIVKLLIDLGADIEYCRDFDEDSIDGETFEYNPIIAAANNNNIEIVQLLINLGANVKSHDNEAINCASEKGHLEIVKLLIESGATTKGNASIIRASHNGHYKIVKLLIESGFGSQVRYNRAIVSACENGHLEIAKLLIELGADIKTQRNRSIIEASRNGHLEIVKLLIELGADATARNNKALMLAKKNNHLDVVKLLIDSVAKE